MLIFNSNTLKYLNICKQMSSGSFKYVTYKLYIYKSYIQYTYGAVDCLSCKWWIVCIIGKFWSLYTDSFFFLPHSLFVFFLSVEGVRELRMEGKKKNTFRLKFFFWGGTTILWCGMFSWTSRNSRAHLGSALKYITHSSSANYKFEGPSCVSLPLAGDTARC